MNEMEALNLALKREQDGQKFYSEAAAKSTNAKGKEVFTWLAREEEGHINLLEKQIAHVRESGKWLDEEKWASSGHISQPIERTEIPSKIDAMGDLDASAPELKVLKAAIEAEKNDVSFYEDAAKATSDPSGKAMLMRLAEVEKGHEALLEEEYEWLSKSKALFTLHRFSLAR